MCASGFVSAQNSAYNKAYADSMGADEWGMKKYYLVILKTGPAQIADKVKRDSLFAGHMSNINRMVLEGKMVVAGPLEKNDKTYRGIFIIHDMSKEELLGEMNQDPTIKNGIFELEILNWYGSAALPAYLPFHKKLEKGSPGK